jgi:anaerobic dimethyl sulfoxide reductase subunit A
MEPLFGCRFEYQWIRETAAYLGLEEDFIDGKATQEEWMKALYDDARKSEPELPTLEEFKSAGCFVFEAGDPHIAFQEIIENKGRFDTPSGKIEIFSKTLYDMDRPDEIPGLPRYTACAEGPDDPIKEKYPLQLIGYHTKRRCHSIHENNTLMEELEPPAVWIHLQDAADRGIKNGELLEIFNDRGCVRIPALVTDRIMKGVVALSEGGWFKPATDGADERGCLNVLTSSRPTPLANGNPQHTNLVQVRKAK